MGRWLDMSYNLTLPDTQQQDGLYKVSVDGGPCKPCNNSTLWRLEWLVSVVNCSPRVPLLVATDVEHLSMTTLTVKCWALFCGMKRRRLIKVLTSRNNLLKNISSFQFIYIALCYTISGHCTKTFPYNIKHQLIKVINLRKPSKCIESSLCHSLPFWAAHWQQQMKKTNF